MTEAGLTDPAFIRRLESLSLIARRVLGGKLQADRRTSRKGAGVQFADYAEYTIGDDHRAIDWRVYGRLGQLIIKLFELEEDMTLVVFLDVSRSMETKLTHAKQLAAAMSYIALQGLDRVVVYAVAERLTPVVEHSHGRAKIMPMLRAIDNVDVAGTGSEFNSACRELQARLRRRAMVLTVSDFFFPGGFDTGLDRLRHAHHEVFCLQVQDQRDQVCDFRGDTDIECVETGQRRSITITERTASAYESAIANWNESLRQACARRGIGHVTTTTDVSFDEIVQNILRRGGLVA